MENMFKNVWYASYRDINVCHAVGQTNSTTEDLFCTVTPVGFSVNTVRPARRVMLRQ